MVPVDVYILKIASRCNLNCTYCFVYNKDDQNWFNQPILMSESVITHVADRALQHAVKNSRPFVEFIFHGGEPLMGGIKHLRFLVQILEDKFRGRGIGLKFAMQTNGLLLSDEILSFCLEKNILVGISIDGPPKINDIYRVDKKGRGSSQKLQEKLKLISSEQYRPVFSGFLVVINPDSDPVDTVEYLSSYHPRGFDFILPYDNHDRLPTRKTSFNDTTYGKWLIKAFDHWYKKNSEVRVRNFYSIISLLLRGGSYVESLGNQATNFLVIETNGEIEAVDSLKATFEGATSLGLNVFENTIDEAAGHLFIVQRQLGSESLAFSCRSCALVSVCGGGYLPNRYSKARGFDNPSIFCHDLASLIYHIHDTIIVSLKTAVDRSPVNVPSQSADMTHP